MRKILIIAGPSAVGKTTVMTEILSMRPDFEYIRSATTRKPRGDVHDAEYIYLTKSEFLDNASSGGMLEYTEYDGNYYGTPSSEIERIFSSGKIPCLVLDVNGVKSLKKKKQIFDVFAVYLTANTETLEKRLYERAVVSGLSEDSLIAYEKRKEVNMRYKKDFDDFSKYFDFVTENITVKETALKIIKAFEE